MDDAFRIVVADDDARLVKLLSGRLRDEGYVVTACDNGAEALEEIVSAAPHVAILDHFMPHLNGREVCQRVRALGVTARLILLTSATDVVDKVAGLDAGADDYVAKPFDFDELLARIRAQLRHFGPRVAQREVLEAMIEALQDRDAAARAAAAERIVHMGGDLSFRALGDFRMAWHGVDLGRALWNRRKPRALLKYLLVHYDRVVSADALMDALWPELDLDAARRNLHVTVQRVRIALAPFGSERVETAEGGYLLRLRPDDRLDIKTFDTLAAEMERALADGEAPLDRMRQMLALYAGDLYTDEPYTEWVTQARGRLRDTFLDLLRRTAVELRARSQVEEACELLRRLLDCEPGDEERAVDLAECLLALDDVGGAAAVLQRSERFLRGELGVAPGERFAATMRKVTPA